jgi:hypothetical protein
LLTLDSTQRMQKLLEKASTGELHKVTARVQGPFGGHNLPVAEMDEAQHMIVFVGGVGAPTVLAILKRLALHRELHHSNHLGTVALICSLYRVYEIHLCMNARFSKLELSPWCAHMHGCIVHAWPRPPKFKH